MSRAFVIMTALPPTRGHLELIHFAHTLAGSGGLTVMLNTQPDEPYAFDRARTLKAGMRRLGIEADYRPLGACRLTRTEFVHLHRFLEQNPNAPGFWDMWRDLMRQVGFRPGDMIVASEPYGQRLADECGGKFMPYDMDRSVTPVKATPVREAPYEHFTDMIPEFRTLLQLRITIFGAESTGKTTLSKALASHLDGYWLFEWARPYLETCGSEITVQSMSDIWEGQRALQLQSKALLDKPYIIQDTDLFSTVGYWDFPHWDSIGNAPEGLRLDAHSGISDLYIVTPSNIPFEQDPLRYGGDVREGSDEYWINVCEENRLNYVVLESSDPLDRLWEAEDHIMDLDEKRASWLSYNRRNN